MKALVRLLEWLVLPAILVVILFWLLEDWLRDRPIGSMEK